MLRTALLLALLPVPAIADDTAATVPEARHAGLEFLWQLPAPDSIARQPTLGFVADGKHAHAVCVFTLPPDARPKGLVLEGADPTGKVVVRREEPDFDGEKRCYTVALGDGEPGRWTWRAYLDGKPEALGEGHIEVARTLEEAPFYRPSSVPYVLGRPNYDPSIPPDEFIGRLVWLIHVDPAGKVTDVEVEVAEGVGERMRERAIAAGYLSLFAPDPGRAAGFTYRRELEFRPD